MGSCTGRHLQKNTIIENQNVLSRDESGNDNSPSSPINRKVNKQKGPIFDSRIMVQSHKEAKNAQILEIPKNPKEIALIRNSLSRHFIFRNLKEYYISVIIHHMKLYNLTNSELIFEQGCPGTNFYVVSKGKLEVVLNGKRVKVLTSGDSFGEVALLHDIARTASVYSLTDVSLWCLDRNTFRSTVEALEIANYEENKFFIDSIPIFETLNPAQKETLLHSITTYDFNPGCVIVKEGDPGDLLYIIKEGIVQITKNNQEVRRMGKGFYFGEQALLYSSPRTATVSSIDNVKCLVISGKELNKVLGNQLKDVIYTNSIRISVEKNHYLQKLTKNQIESLINSMKIKSFENNEVVIQKGTCFADFFWVVVRGNLVRASDKEVVGKVFDAVNADNMINKATGNFEENVIAYGDVMVAFISVSDFEERLGGTFEDVTSNNDAFKVLRRIQILRGLSTENMQALMQVMKIKEFINGATVVEQNDQGDAFFIVKSGKAAVLKDGTNVRTISKHDYFGERSLLFNNFRSATVKAKGNLVCWVIHKSEFIDLLEDNIKKNLLARIDLQDDTAELKDLTIVKLLGSGMFGNVFLVLNKQQQMLYALKTVDRRKIAAYEIHDNIVLERRILLELDHIFIMKLIKTFKDSHRLYFLLEFIRGMDLFDVLRQLGLLSEGDSKFYAACLLVILEHLHEREIIYRDLKPENIVIDEEGYPKLIDFGTAKFIKGKTFTIVGTPHYMAPEVITGHGYSLSADYWSLGVITYEFLYARVPFGENEMDPYLVYEKIQERNLEFPRWSDKRGKSKEFITQLLSRNPAKRLGGGFDIIKSSAWFTGFDWDKLLSKIVKAPYVPKTKDLKNEINTAIYNKEDLEDSILKVEAKANVPAVRKNAHRVAENWDKDF